MHLTCFRIEAGLIFAGYEFCDQTDPFEAGISLQFRSRLKRMIFLEKNL